VARFESLTSYRNDKGAEWVMASNVQFRNFLVFDHASSGIEIKTIAGHEDANTALGVNFFKEPIGSLISDATIIGNSDASATQSVTNKGLIIPWDRGLLVKNSKFINFPDQASFAIGATVIVGRCL
jgi:hypothetical protein